MVCVWWGGSPSLRCRTTKTSPEGSGRKNRSLATCRNIIYRCSAAAVCAAFFTFAVGRLPAPLPSVFSVLLFSAAFAVYLPLSVSLPALRVASFLFHPRIVSASFTLLPPLHPSPRPAVSVHILHISATHMVCSDLPVVLASLSTITGRLPTPPLLY